MILSSFSIGCTSMQKDEHYYASKAWQYTGKYEQHPNKYTLKRALKYIDKAVEAQGGDYTWNLIEIKVEMLLTQKKREEGLSFVEKFTPNDFLYPYQREMYLNLFKSIKLKELGKDNSGCFKANRALINKYLNDKKIYFVKCISVSDYVTESHFITIVCDLLVNELNLRNEKELMQYIDSLQCEFGGNSRFYSLLKKNLFQSNHITVRANKRLK